MHNGMSVLVLIGIVVLWLVAAQIWPYTPCSRCNGGKHPSPSKRHHRKCGKCGGSGTRRRFGAFFRD